MSSPPRSVMQQSGQLPPPKLLLPLTFFTGSNQIWAGLSGLVAAQFGLRRLEYYSLQPAQFAAGGEARGRYSRWNQPPHSSPYRLDPACALWGLSRGGFKMVVLSPPPSKAVLVEWGRGGLVGVQFNGCHWLGGWENFEWEYCGPDAPP